MGSLKKPRAIVTPSASGACHVLLELKRQPKVDDLEVGPPVILLSCVGLEGFRVKGRV